MCVCVCVGSARMTRCRGDNARGFAGRVCFGVREEALEFVVVVVGRIVGF